MLYSVVEIEEYDGIFEELDHDECVPIQQICDIVQYGDTIVNENGEKWSLLDFHTYQEFNLDINYRNIFVNLAITNGRVDLLSQCKDHGIDIDLSDSINTACCYGEIPILDLLYSIDPDGFSFPKKLSMVQTTQKSWTGSKHTVHL